MLNRLKLLHHSHTAQLRPHEHTSYLPLGILLLVVGLSLAAYSVSAQSPPPQEGSIGLTGTVPEEPPEEAATITTPKNQERFDTTPVTVAGTCAGGTLVEVFKNDIFAGSVLCDDNDKFSMQIDLMFGKNVLVARVFNSLNQPGPDSNKVTVFYDALPPQSESLSQLEFRDAQLLLNTDAIYRGLFPEKEFYIPIEILGGSPPYAVNVQWGDATNRVVPRHDNTPFKVNHEYPKPGTYQITLQASDAVERAAFLTVAAIVNGQPAVPASSDSSGATPNQLLILWPLYTSLLAIVFSFWLGEQREKRILAKRGFTLGHPGQA